MTLSQRLTYGLIGEDEKPYLLENHTTMYEEVERNELRAEQRQALKPTIATIEADLKGLLPKRKDPKAKHLFTTATGTQVQYVNEPYINGYNQALNDMLAAIEHYTRGK